MIVKNIEAKIRLATWVAVGSFLTSIVLSAICCSYAYRQVSDARKSIYILSNGIPLQAGQTDMQVNRPAEYRADIDLFHALFFSLTPDDKYIEYQLKKAMYLVDESGVDQYNNLKENGFFNSILSSSSVITLQTDSISLDMTRYLKDIPRSDNNPHGVLIVNWKTLENKDLENVQKNTF